MKIEKKLLCSQCRIAIRFVAEWVPESGHGYWEVLDTEHDGEPDCRSYKRQMHEVQTHLDRNEPNPGDLGAFAYSGGLYD